MKADGNLLAFFDRPIAATLGVITIGIWVLVAGGAARRWWRGRTPAAAPSSAE
jgi:putative tricarboxylic transport membrane protein